MSVMSAAQAAEKWKISRRWVELLCAQGRIEGAQHLGKMWIIPCDAKKPEDARVRSGKYQKGGAVNAGVTRRKIAVAGAGYVGLSIALLLARDHDVRIVEVAEEKIEQINHKHSPIREQDLADALRQLTVTATSDWQETYRDADVAVIAVPTNYDESTGHFDTGIIENCIEEILSVNASCTIAIKSTVPIGYTKSLREKYKTDRILFSPEFLREGRALTDNLHPARIIVGDKGERGRAFADLLQQSAMDKDVPVLLTGSSEAEAIKLFANAYLAMRVGLVNETDTFCELRGLDTSEVIQGVGMDPRIGLHYNNPSFGYSGYCLPKDTKQLQAEFDGIPENLISAIVETNETRKKHIAERILSRRPAVVGIYGLAMKFHSDNFRASAILDIIEMLKQNHVSCVIYEPALQGDSYAGCPLIRDLDAFKKMSDLVITNRLDTALHDLEDIPEKVYTRDIFHRD